NKALIIKSAALTGVESGTSDSTSAVSIPFLSETAVGALPAGAAQRGYYYFDSDGSNGYQDSGAASYSGDSDPKYKYGLKGAIDYYYNHSLKAYENSILAVDLHDPDFDTFKAGFNPETGNKDTYNTWEGAAFTGYYKDIHFATTYSSGGTKQAFALSYGDLNRSIDSSEEITLIDGSGLSFNTSYSKLLDFSGGDGSVMDIFWLRSAGMEFASAGTVYNGIYSSVPVFMNADEFPTRIRPALWVKLN
ncbi:MAG: hypothetical protein LBS33_04145, partial [Streptococcaceae bacterium]|nr:hypothetical protein [Streptococcaceae bacterium]